MMVRVEGREITLRPIAGTRPRGATEAEDLRARTRTARRSQGARRARDAGRSRAQRRRPRRQDRLGQSHRADGGRALLARDAHRLERGRRAAATGCDAFDAFRATFPQGTVSGAPKIRAMEIIDELEPVRRGVYAGAVGYFSYTGNTDTAIALRTLLIKNDRVYIQAGGGVVADSDPGAEFEESVQQGARDGSGARRGARLRSCGGAEVSAMARQTRLMIDNYDSFTYNLVQYLGELGAERDRPAQRRDRRRRRARAGIPTRSSSRPDPCTPAEAGISVALLRELAGELPMLGVCLGHQCIGEAFGGKVVRAAA